MIGYSGVSDADIDGGVGVVIIQLTSAQLRGGWAELGKEVIIMCYHLTLRLLEVVSVGGKVEN